MKTPYTKLIVAGIVLATAPVAAKAAVFGANIQTTVDASQTGGGITDRLYNNSVSTPANESPVGSKMWFVADTAGDGLPNFTLGVTPTSVLGADDVIVFQDSVDGTLFGNQTGRYSRTGAQIDTTYQNKNIYAFLWASGTPTAEADVVAGNTFGIFNLGTPVVPQIGNANWFISQNINGSEFNVTAVPEPASVASVGLVLAGFAAVRRFRKQVKA